MSGSLKFEYTTYHPEAIKWFLDYCYCASEPLESLSMEVILAIMHFLHAEGKTVVSGLHLKLLADQFLTDK